MEDRQQWLTIAAIVIVVAGLGFFLYRQSRQESQVEVSNELLEQQNEQRAQEVIEQMQFTIPDDAQRATLTDVSGGTSIGVATKVETATNQLSASVVASLPEPATGQFYEAYLVDDQDSSSYLGKLRAAKGGWILDATIPNDATDKVRVTLEETDDKQAEKTVLEGVFPAN